MRTTVGLLAVAAVLLAGCSSDNGDRAGGSPTSKKASGPLGDLDGDALCEMVDRAVVEKQFGEPIEATNGAASPPDLGGGVGCQYMSKGLMDSDIEHQEAEAGTATEALDHHMTNLGKKVAYQPVTGLGLGAGYTNSELDAGAEENELATIIEADGAFVEVVVKAAPAGTLNQLRPIATELVDAVETELG